MAAHATRGNPVEIFLFDVPRFVFEGEHWLFKAPPRALPLLALLLLHPNRVLPRELIASTIWPDDDSAEASANLRRHLHYIKRALPPSAVDWFSANRRFAGWNMAAPATVDIHQFEQLTSDPGRRSEAVSLYAGDLYIDCYDEWIMPHRARYHALQLSTLNELFQKARAGGDGALSQIARAILSLEPWREDILRDYMQIRNEAGDRSGALAAFREFATHIQQELDTEPSQETLTLFQAISADDEVDGAGYDVVIVDDESLARARVRSLLQQCFPKLTIAGEFNNGAEAVEGIRELKPALVFLDIEMPAMDGFGVIDSLGLQERPKAVVFTTAYSEFGAKAFDVRAVDYLVKPFSQTRFIEAVEHALHRMRSGSRDEQIAALRSKRPPQ